MYSSDSDTEDFLDEQIRLDSLDFYVYELSREMYETFREFNASRPRLLCLSDSSAFYDILRSMFIERNVNLLDCTVSKKIAKKFLNEYENDIKDNFKLFQRFVRQPVYPGFTINEFSAFCVKYSDV